MYFFLYISLSAVIIQIPPKTFPGDGKEMRIKRLEILGFKSFMERTVFNFQSGVTAIVGPNGCGKSNIVDAIKWVLGEQSAKQLRGKSMEDVIFNGSSSFKPLGMAEVTILFENTDGNLLEGFSEYSEVEICRRLYRSGESEYYINKVPCRRKDVWELFLNTGVGTRAYSIVEQDRIGVIINAKPEDRRFIVEEAAGISKYRSRKEEALRKIEATRQNLLRINDVLKEIERQMKALERQAHQAEKYRSLREDYKKIEIALRAQHLWKIEKEQRNILENLRTLKDRSEDLKLDLERKGLTIERCRLDMAEKERVLLKHQEALYRLEAEIQKAEGEKNYAEMELERIKSIYERERIEKEEIYQKIRKTGEEIEWLTCELATMENNLNGEKEELLVNEKAFNEKNSLVLDINGCMDREKAQLIEDLTRRATLKNALVNCRKQIEGIQASSKKIERERIEIIERLALLKEEMARIMVSMDKLDLQKKAQERTLSLNMENYEKLSKSLEEKKGKLEVKMRELTQKESRLKSLEELQGNYEGYSIGVRDIMLAQKEGAFEGNGNFQLLTEVMEVPQKYEGLIEIFLSDRLQSLIVENETDVIKAIEYLKKGSSGRSSFIIMNLIRCNDHFTESEISSPNDEMVLLKDLIKMQPGFEKVKDILFRDVIVVQDLQMAMRVWGKNGCTKTIITLDGDLVQPPGIISGGKENGNFHGLLARRREIKELQAMVNQLKEDIERIKKIVEMTSKKVRMCREEGEDLERSIKKLEFQLQSLKMERTRREEEVQACSRRKEFLDLEKEQLNEEIRKLEQEEISTEDKVIEMEERIHLRERDIEKMKKRYTDIQEEIKEITDDLQRRRISIASMTEKIVNIKENLERLKEMKRGMDERLSSIAREMEESRSEERRLEAIIEGLKKGLVEFNKRQREIKDEMERERDIYRILSDELQKMEMDYKGIREERSAIEEKIQRLMLEEQEIRLRKEHLTAELFERYGIKYNDLPSIKEMDPDEEEATKLKLNQLREVIEGFGEVNLMAIDDFQELKKRYDFMASQQEDLINGIKRLQRAIARINRNSKRQFMETFNAINESFKVVFPRLFNGGEAYLVLTEPQEVLESGVDIVVQPPGKKLLNISLLSGGEKALAAVALLFSILLIRPTPFCLFDEVDAPLDEANIDRFINIIQELSRTTQFILVTHNKRTMEIADVLYGITMEEPGISKLISVRLG